MIVLYVAAVLIAMLHSSPVESQTTPTAPNGVTYKLIYFDARYRGEGARLIFAQAGVPYEDYRVPRKDWPAFKPKTPFGHLPVLEFGGEMMGETFAIDRYLARQFGLAGSDAVEQAFVDSIADAFKDFFDHNQEALRDTWNGGSVDKAFAETIVPARDSFLTPLQNFLKKANSGFAVGKSVTWADLIITEYLSYLQSLRPDFLDGYPLVMAYVNRVRSLPNIKAWIEKRPITDH